MRDWKYINSELMENTERRTLYDALNRECFYVVVSDGVWWTETLPFMSIGDRRYKTLKKEMKRLYPDLTFLYWEHERRPQ